MPELPEVEVLVRHLAPLLRGRTIGESRVWRPKVVAPSSPAQFADVLRGATFLDVSRRGKHLLFHLSRARTREPFLLVGHLGMTGRMCLLPPGQRLPRHCSVTLELLPRPSSRAKSSRPVLAKGRADRRGDTFVFEDTRYFGRLTLATECLDRLGPEPLEGSWTPVALGRVLARSAQPVKIKLLDQAVVAGVGNIYASEALFLARISPLAPSDRLSPGQVRCLCRAVRRVLREAIRGGSTVPLNFSGQGERDGLFYYGRAPGAAGSYEERLRVYDRAGQPCLKCEAAIRRIVQGGRSTFFCPACQQVDL